MPDLAPLHFSQLKHIARSPLHFKHALSTSRKDKRHFRIGRAVDMLHTGNTEKLIIYPGERRGKKWADFEAAQPADAEIITESEKLDIYGMAGALHKRTDALDLLQGDRQRMFQWSIAGRPCEGTPDCFTWRRVTDLKSTRNADPRRFKWDARKLGYHAQLSWYAHGLRAAKLAEPTECYIVAVESEAPYPVVVYQLTPDDLERGAKLWRGWFETLRTCEESDHWPGYTEGIVPLDLPIPEELEE